MGRKPGDGRGKLGGGMQKGQKKKDSPLKALLKNHSLQYFTPSEKTIDGKTQTTSQFDLDILELDPDQRVTAEIKLLEFHQPKMRAVDVNQQHNVSITIEDTIARLIGDDDK